MGFESTYGITLVPTGLAGPGVKAFEHNTRKYLSWIEGTKVGHLLLKAIAWHVKNTPGNIAGGTIPIQPFTGAGCNSGENNSVNTPTGFSQPSVSFSPGVFGRHGACYAQLVKKSTNRALYPDELLFHELVHALRGASARFNNSALTGGLVNYDGKEEFIAVLTTNIYISDPSNHSKTGLRKDHHGFTPLEKELAGSFEFFRSSKNTFTLVDQFCTENPAFTKWVAGVKARFNPLAAYYQNKAKAQSFSNSATALLRDGDLLGAMNALLGQILTGH